MHDHDLAMLTYVKLADLSQQKRQPIGRDKFLLLAGVEACRAGWPEIADRCRELVLHHNAAHLVGRFPTLPDALRDPEFQTFLKQLERFCPWERAEHLLQELTIPTDVPEVHQPASRGDYAQRLLAGERWVEKA